MSGHTFQVDLRGVVDLLSHHLYSSPKVYVRELMQNSVDAVTARRGLDPAFAGRIRIEPPEATGDGSLRVHDDGIGLTEAQVHELLATIGGSAKRDDLGYARHEFLGQFGIGLLSCFLVSDTIEVLTRSAVEPDAPPVLWRGGADGRYTVAEGPADTPPGTSVTLHPRPGTERWLSGRVVRELAEEYGGLLPYPVSVADETVTSGGPLWLSGFPDAGARKHALLRYGERLLGQRPFDVVDLEVPEAGLTGVAFVLAQAAHPSRQGRHRVYLKRMLLGDRTERLLPDWAFFAHCVVDTSELRPTASREQLYDDDLLHSTREALGARLRLWLIDLARTAPDRLARFLSVHASAVLSLAVHDDDMLRLVYEWLPFETSDGRVPLAEFGRRHRRFLYSDTHEEFTELSAIAAAQGLGLVDGGLAYTAEILGRLPLLLPGVEVRRLDPTELATTFTEVDGGPDTERFLEAARPALHALGCLPQVRAFEPPTVPALYLESVTWRTYHEEVEARAQATDAWSALLGTPSAEPVETRDVLMLNHHNPLVRRLLTLTDPDLVRLAVRVLYGQTLLTGHRPLRPADATALSRSFLGLLDRAVRGAEREEER
jgi:molecular chaperone HtpG